ncbi:hypothetical protein CYMTET_51475 [Cymbomonas tetramitiformis]|uniref:Uncharacterized protein n=1 Tax=Cymbomonas tetramitiformis TaxID=36881 RepID=A0AAE0ESL7_9CHLO|nr:hypothetical protein CYMTET_51475 [Cymbomonas tetramitiformis]
MFKSSQRTQKRGKRVSRVAAINIGLVLSAFAFLLVRRLRGEPEMGSGSSGIWNEDSVSNQEAAEDGQELSLSFSDSAETGESTAPHLDTADAGIANGDILEQSTQILQQLTSSQEEDTLGADRGSLKKISADPYFSAEGEEQKQVECKVDKAMHHKDKLAFFEANPQCNFLNSCEAELPAVSNTTGVNPIHSTYIFRYDDTIKYSHMAMIERLPDERFIAAWCAQPPLPSETH